MKEQNCEKYQSKYKRIFLILLSSIIVTALLPSVYVKAADAITRFTLDDEVYYLTDHQMDYVNQLRNKNDYDGILNYMESLGDDVHYFAIEDGVLYGGFENYDPVKEVKIPNSVHTIADYAFQGCSQLTKVIMSENVKTIGYGAFADCSSLKDIKFSKNLESIGQYAFQKCKSLTSISLPSKLTTIEYAAFLNCTSLKRVVLPKSVKSVKSFAFYGCSKLKSMKMLSNVTEIGERALDHCTALEDVITTKGSYAEQYTRENLSCAIMYTSKPAMKTKVQYLLVGDTYNSMVYHTYDSKVTYKTTNAKVAKVDKKGKVTAVSAGKTTVSAVVNGTTLKCTIVVLEKNVDNRVKQFTKNNTTKSMSDYQIITLAHEWLIKNVSYDNEGYMRGDVQKASHTAEGALLDGVAVCDGYSYAFKEIMDEFNIPCKVVVGTSNGEGHAWNMVKIKDQWYHIDVTYDDPIINGSNQNTKVYKTYFLISDEQMKKDHTWITKNYETCTAKSMDKKFVSER